MMDSQRLVRGIVHGGTIVLDQDPGLPDGEVVRLSLMTDADARIEEAWNQVQTLPPVEGLRLPVGAWAEDSGALGEYLSWNRQQWGGGLAFPQASQRFER